MLKISLSCCLMLLGTFQSYGQANWKDLFNGSDLKGWVKRNGNADYKLANKTIIGVSQLNTPNTFLCTEENYGDFVLEMDVKVEPGLNSGIQIRSFSDPADNNGRVRGYQIEIDPGDRAWSGGIYDEARNGWLYPLSINPKGQKAFRNGQWNTYHIEAIGPRLKTWINGIPCANVLDPQTPRGFIALQVHQIKREEQNGLTVQWRNIRIATENLKEAVWPGGYEIQEVNYLPNQLSDSEKRKGWRLLWDGKTSAGWRVANGDQFPSAGWAMQDGVLKVLGSKKDSVRKGGDIETVETFANFELELDFKLTTGGNSGVKYFVVEDRTKKPGTGLGPEFQLLDDKLHPDAKAGVNGNRTTGSLYDLITAENLSEGSTEKRMNLPGKWNKMRIVSKDGHVEHWLNNLKVVEYDRRSQIFRNLVAKSKYSTYPNFAQAASGHILFQDHGDEVHFRSIKIREL
ncbi:3-keto-disaccharide hydrolase [Fibrella aquatica]|uniref:3-keto-disaccharide hydrolase n=1 Tax=Fibrella aquatica TaxID=3242487 RepID=UPI0035203945